LGKYSPLENYLKQCQGKTLTLTYKEIEQILGDKLPMSAYKHQAWWANGGHYYAESWLGAGWKVDEV